MLLLKVLLEAAGAGAGLGRHLRIEEVEAALESSLKKASCIVADTRGHIVGRNVHRAGVRRGQADGNTPSRFISGSGVFSHTKAAQTLPSFFAWVIKALFASWRRLSKKLRYFRSLIAFPPKLLFLPIHPFRIVNIISLYTPIINLNIQFIQICLN